MLTKLQKILCYCDCALQVLLRLWGKRCGTGRWFSLRWCKNKKVRSIVMCCGGTAHLQKWCKSIKVNFCATSDCFCAFSDKSSLTHHDNMIKFSFPTVLLPFIHIIVLLHQLTSNIYSFPAAFWWQEQHPQVACEPWCIWCKLDQQFFHSSLSICCCNLVESDCDNN